MPNVIYTKVAKKSFSKDDIPVAILLKFQPLFCGKTSLKKKTRDYPMAYYKMVPHMY
jgi:hypothetical protein